MIIYRMCITISHSTGITKHDRICTDEIYMRESEKNNTASEREWWWGYRTKKKHTRFCHIIFGRVFPTMNDWKLWGGKSETEPGEIRPVSSLQWAVSRRRRGEGLDLDQLCAETVLTALLDFDERRRRWRFFLFWHAFRYRYVQHSLVVIITEHR